MDMKINLTGRGLGPVITTPPKNAPKIPQMVKYAAIHFIRHHLHHDLKTILDGGGPTSFMKLP
jgi:hypothetical protein